MSGLVYLDYHATTPCDPRVVAAMLPYFSQEFGNPSNTLHRPGRRAAVRIGETPRRQGDGATDRLSGGGSNPAGRYPLRSLAIRSDTPERAALGAEAVPTPRSAG